MPVYDPRTLIKELREERRRNIAIVKENEKRKIQYEELLEKYEELKNIFLSPKDELLDVSIFEGGEEKKI
jgi:hypothetical protein